MHDVKFLIDHHGFGILSVDGVELQNFVRGFELKSQAGNQAELVLDITPLSTDGQAAIELGKLGIRIDGKQNMGHQLKGCVEDGFVYCSICKQEMPKASVYAIPCVELAWTTEKPTKPGWYWRRSEGVAKVVQVIDCGDGYLYAEGVGLRWSVYNLSGEWAGPLEPPE